MGYFCVFRHDGGTEADWTEPFNFPVNGDFTITINSTGEGLDADTTMDVSVQGSVNGTDYVDLHTDLIDGVQISAFRDVNEPLNELAYVSARSFSVEETERIPVAPLQSCSRKRRWHFRFAASGSRPEQENAGPA